MVSSTTAAGKSDYLMATTTETRKDSYTSLKHRLGVLDTTAVTFTRSRATQAAASLAYYTFFSIFPLMLLLILGGSYFLDRQNMLQRVTQAVQSVLPISQQFIVQNLQQVLQQRAAVGIFVLVSLLWSASGMFNNLAYEINKAWPEAQDRNFLQSRLIGIDMILGRVGLLILSVILDSLSKWFGGASASGGPVANFTPLAIISSLGSWIMIFLLFLAMYRWVPTVHVAWSASIWGAVVAALGWKAATTGFAWYLASPFAHYQLIYGSLGAIVAFLFLIYIIALVTLFGAHLTAAVDHLYQKQIQSRVAVAPAGANAVPVTGAYSDTDIHDTAEEDEQKKEDGEWAQAQADKKKDANPPPYPKDAEAGEESESQQQADEDKQSNPPPYPEDDEPPDKSES